MVQIRFISSLSLCPWAGHLARNPKLFLMGLTAANHCCMNWLMRGHCEVRWDLVMVQQKFGGYQIVISPQLEIMCGQSQVDIAVKKLLVDVLAAMLRVLFC